MMAQFIKCGKWCLLVGLLCALFFAIAFPVYADNEALINSPDWAPYQWFASTDTKHENEDYIELKSGETRKIPLTDGIIERFWWTALKPENIKVSLVQKNGQTFEIPGSPKYTHEKAFAYARPETTFTSVFAVWQLQKYVAFVVKNVGENAESNKFFYQVAIRPSQPALTPLLPQEAIKHSTEKIELSPGGEKTIELTGAGLIETISLSFNQAQDVKSLAVRAAWDGEQKNAVDAPLAALLGLFGQGESVHSAAFDFSAKKADLRWPMPFGKGAQITLVNIGNAPLKGEVRVDSLALGAAPKYRFYAIYGSARTQEKKPVQILKVTGKGAFCGLNLSISPASDSGRRTFAYLEGNETITADGKKYEGTGSEDFFSSAWYFPKKPFSFPYHGLTFKTASPPAVGAYRLMIPDALPFKKSLQFDFEHGNNNNSNDLLFRWAAFWYGEPQSRFEIADALHYNAKGNAPEGFGGPSHLNIFLVALATSLIVGGGGGLLVKIARKRAEKRV